MDPLAITVSIVTSLTRLKEDYRALGASLRSALQRLEHAERLLSHPNLDALVPDHTLRAAHGTLIELKDASARLEKALSARVLCVPVGRASVCAGGCLFGSSVWLRRIDSLSGQLEDAMRFVDQYVAIADAFISMGPVASFRSEPQKMFWRNYFGDATEVEHGRLARAFRSVSRLPESTCLHIASGIGPGQNFAGVSAVAAALGDEDPGEWAARMSSRTSRTAAFAGHSKAVTHVACVGDWRVTCSDDRTAKLFCRDVLQAQLVGHEKRVRMSCLVARPLGSADAYTIGDDHTLRGWDGGGAQRFSHHTGDAPPAFVGACGEDVVYFCKDQLTARIVGGADGAARLTVSPLSGTLHAIHRHGDLMWCVSRAGFVSSVDVRYQYQPAVSGTSKLGHQVEAACTGPLGVAFAGGGMLSVLAPCGRRSQHAFPDRRVLALSATADGFLLALASDARRASVHRLSRDGGWAVHDAPPTRSEIACAAFEAGGDLALGTSNGSTVVVASDAAYGRLRTVVLGCMDASAYLYTLASDNADILASICGTTVLVGPRKSRSVDESAHGILLANPRSAYLWNVRHDGMRNVTEQLLDIIEHAENLRCDGWCVCERKDNACTLKTYQAEHGFEMELSAGRGDEVRGLHGVGDCHLAVEISGETGSRIEIVRPPGRGDPEGARAEPATVVDNARLLCVVKTGVVVLQDLKVRHVDASGASFDVAVDVSRCVDVVACETDRGLVVLRDGEILRLPDLRSPPSASSRDIPREIEGLAHLAGSCLVGFGNNGRFFMLSDDSLTVVTTYVTHPARKIVVKPNRVSLPGLLVHDLYGAFRFLPDDVVRHGRKPPGVSQDGRGEAP